MAEALVTGGAAIQRLLGNIDVDQRIGEIERDLPSARGLRRTKLNRELRYLNALKEQGLKPDEAFVISKVPVLPPAMRPLYVDERGTLISSDLNELYQGLGAVNEQLHHLEDLPDGDKADLRRDLYDGVKAVQGLGDPITHKQNLKGIFRQIAGTRSPKGGFFQSRLTRRRQNVSGRSTITLGPDLDVDQVGLPEEMAWTLFRPFAVRELVQAGHKQADALKEMETRSPVGRQALEAALRKRPVWLNRAPSLHRHSIMALEPVLTPGKDIKINPLTVKGWNADFDGDSMSVHVPVTPAAVEEAKQRKPSDILFAAGTEKLMLVPGQSAALGLYLMSHKDGDPVGSFDSEKEALKAAEKGDIRLEDTITVDGQRTTAGRLQIDAWLPENFRDYGMLDKKGLTGLLTRLATAHPRDYGKVVHNLRQLGDEYATQRGFSLGLEDLKPVAGLRQTALDKADRTIKSKAHARPEEREQAFVDAFREAAREIEAKIGPLLTGQDNAIGHMLLSGSRGSPAQVRQIVAAPLIAHDSRGRPIPTPIRHAYAEGLDGQEYYAAGYGARAGAIGRSHQTALPGALAKEVLASVVDAVVTETKNDDMPSLELETARPDEDLIDRFVARTVRGRDGKLVATKNSLVTPRIIEKARQLGVQKLSVYTPLNAELPGGGIPAMAFGLNEVGQLPDIGANLGLLAGHSMTEPISQMTLDAFHSGGTGARGRVGKFDRIKQLFELPRDLPGKATLAKTTGQVDVIQESPAGGWDIQVAGQTHYVPKDNPLTIKEGDRIRRGESLSEGPINPHELLALKDLDAVQEYLTDEIQKETGVKRRWVEVVVGAMTNHAIVDQADDRDGLFPGDVVPSWKVKQLNAARQQRVPLADAIGKKKVGTGTHFEEGELRTLERKGEAEVNIELDLVEATPVLKGANMLPLLKAGDNWMAGMDFRRLKDVISEGVLNQRWSELSGTNPIPAVAYGAHFGLGEKGKY